MTVEAKALLLDPTAVLRLVSALRTYRDASAKLLKERHPDGECDAFQLHVFGESVHEANRMAGYEEDDG